jgi:DNA-binding transcriptional regulator YhcF (GntR family)
MPTAEDAKMGAVAALDLWNGGAASLADSAYLRLREEIIGVELAPGTLLREEELTRRLGVGRTPVREAVQRLHRDGFVTVIPRRGTLVSEINITDLAGIYEVRAHLESWAARLAAERAGGADRAEAQELLGELETMATGVPYEAASSSVSGSPSSDEGSTNAAALPRIAARMISRGWARLIVNVPSETTLNPQILCCPSSSTTISFSWGESSKNGLAKFTTEPIPAICAT